MLTGTTPVASIKPLMCSIVKLETPIALTYQKVDTHNCAIIDAYGLTLPVSFSLIIVFQVSTREVFMSKSTSPSLVGCGGTRPFPGSNATGQCTTVTNV